MKAKDLLDVSLKSENGNPVSLNSLSNDALESFLIVVSSMKEIITSCIDDKKIKFKILEGSARCYAEAPVKDMQDVYNLINTAIEGKSYDKDITRNLRVIQGQLKNKAYEYKFMYSNSNKPSNLGERLINSKTIISKRRVGQFQYKLSILSGYLNEVGGVSPNYHFDYGGEERKLTIQCSKDEAIEVKKYLYTKVSAFLLIKEWNEANRKNDNLHIDIIEEEKISSKLRVFLRKYNDNSNLVDRLSSIYDFIEKSIAENQNDGLKILNYLLKGFNDKNFHMSELKTLLVISRPFDTNEFIKEARLNLLETYAKKR